MTAYKLKTQMSTDFSILRLVACTCLVVCSSALGGPISETEAPKMIVSTVKEPMTPGKFQPTWGSLRQYQTPEWFRDAKFGIWFCYGPQCEPEDGDWYARNMYAEGSAQYRFHVATYGPPSRFGFKDVIHLWKADKWDADKLVTLYERAGAQYIFVMANHHDNFDLYDSKYQRWNSVKVGPMKDIVGDVAKAAKAHHLRLGVTVHAAHAWPFYELAQGADKKGNLAGVPYDGNLTLADGKGKWWEGLDPQALYAQSHTPSVNFEKPNTIHNQWDWNNGASIPDAAYCEQFYDRTIDLVHKYQPDVLYFDDDVLPLWPVSDAGLKIAADFYNCNMQWHDGKLDAVMLGKTLDEDERKCLVWDIERGTSNRIEPLAWQTDTCIGQWHYSRPLYERTGYKSAQSIIRTLADIVSKNGNLMLNIPVRGDGSIDEKEAAVLEDLATWMATNKECIFGTRPWKVYGEGPVADAPQTTVGNFNEGKGKPFSADDIRFTTRNGAVYAIVLGSPPRDVTIKSLGSAANLFGAPVGHVKILGSEEVLQWFQTADSLTIKPPKTKLSEAAIVFRISS